MKTLIFAVTALALATSGMAEDKKPHKKHKDQPSRNLPAGNSGPTGGYGSNPSASKNPEGTGGGVSDPGKSTSGGNAGNVGAASNPATGQAGKPEANSGVSGTPSNP